MVSHEHVLWTSRTGVFAFWIGRLTAQKRQNKFGIFWYPKHFSESSQIGSGIIKQLEQRVLEKEILAISIIYAGV